MKRYFFKVTLIFMVFAYGDKVSVRIWRIWRTFLISSRLKPQKIFGIKTISGQATMSVPVIVGLRGKFEKKNNSTMYRQKTKIQKNNLSCTNSCF